jgi:hypothetical protein
VANNFERPLRTEIPQVALDDMLKEPLLGEQEIEVELVDEEGFPMEGEAEVEAPEVPWDGNIAEVLETTDLIKLGSDLVAMYESDLASRKDWEDAYVKGMDLLGMKVEDRSQPWPGASGVFHPVLAEAVVRFQAQTMSECWPASGPAMSQVLGTATPEKTKAAKRVSDEINHFCTNLMPEYRSETEQMLFRLPLAGSAFKKIYLDEIAQRPVAMFVPAEDLVAPYGSSNLQACERFTHSMRRTANELKKLMAAGFYRKVELSPPAPRTTKIEDKTSRIIGHKAMYEYDDRHHVLEMHVNVNIPGWDDEEDIAKPYIVTILKDEDKILSIRRNWVDGDPNYTRNQYFVHYPYLPGLGLYGTGLIHLVGGLAKSATSILRQLVDAGTLSNLPAGFKAKGLRIKAEDQEPLRPGEFRDVDAGGNAIRDSLYPIPIKEPSQVLLQLLGSVVDEARRIGSVADLKITDMSSQAPVGTTLALLERSLKVMSGVQARVHAALKEELRLLHSIIGILPGTYQYDAQDGFDRATDFSEKISIVPVSDPNASTMAQRVVQYQAAMEIASKAPDIYNLPKLHMQMLDVLGIKEAQEIVKQQTPPPMLDPVSENMAIITSQPVKAFIHQDHKAHLDVHMNFAQDPKIQQMVGQSPQASAVMGAMSAHIAEHIAFQYRAEIEMTTGVPLPPPGQPLPEDVEVGMSKVVAAASGKLMAQNKAAIAQQKAEEALQDPMVQIELGKLQNAKDEVARKQAKDAIDAILKMRELVGDNKIEVARIAADLITKMQGLSQSKAQANANAAVTLVKAAVDAASAKEIAEGKARNGRL